MAEMPHLVYLDLEIANAVEERYVRKVGKIDTGSSITVIPDDLREELTINEASTVKAKGFDSEQKEYDTYYIHVKINNIIFGLMEVLSRPRKNVLVGRDLINLWKMKLDGQNRTGEAEVWSTNPVDASLP